jgi:plasmid stability protein
MVFVMITLTIKGIPKETHRELKKRAAVNRRSLNNEIIFTLETLLGSVPRKCRAAGANSASRLKKVTRRK